MKALRQQVESLLGRIEELQSANVQLRQANLELTDSRDKYLDLYDFAPIGYFLLEPDGIILDVNLAGTNLLAMPKWSLIRKPFALFVLEEDREIFEAHFRLAFETLAVQECEIRLVRAIAGTFHAHVESRAVQYENGAKKLCRIVVSDASKLQRAAETIVENEKRFRQVYDNAPVMMHSIDRHGILRNVNKKWLTEMGYERSEVIGKSVELVMTPDARVALARNLYQFWDSGRISDLEYQYIKKDGSIIDVLLDSVAVYDAVWGQVSLSVMRNVTYRKQAEESLRQSEARYRALFENISNGVAIYRAVNEAEDFVLLDFNRAAERIDHISREDLLGKSVIKAFPGIKDFGLFEVLQRVWRTGQPEHFPTKLYKEGRLGGWRENFVYKLPTQEIVTVYSDETDRKLAEEALRQSEERYRSIGELIPYGAWVAGSDPGATYVSQSFLDMVGLTLEEYKTFGWIDRLPSEDAHKTMSLWKHCAQTGDMWDVEYRIRDRHGRYRWILSRGIPIRNDRGDIVSWVGINLDISDRKRSEHELRTSEERFRAIFEGARDCIYIQDRSLRYTHVNPAMEKLFGLPASQIIGRSPEDLYGEEAGRRVREVDLRVLAGESVEEEHTRPINGVEITFHDIRVPLRNSEGVIIGTCGFARNITERKKAEPHRIAFRECASEAMHATLAQARYAAAKDSIVLLQGESGSGKDYLARWIHDRSRRADGPFFAVNCAAIPHDLAESELFGHERGAFTGALGRKRGLLELAEGGTLLLNEIGELSLALQSKLLAFLDTRSFLRVGGEKQIRVNARLIAATHRDLEGEVGKGRFLEALFYRLNVFSISVPPLRERREDIPLLVEEILSQLSSEMQLSYIPKPDQESLDALLSYHWPGNVRELRNVLERSLMLSGGGRLNVVLPLAPGIRESWSHRVLFPDERSLHDVTDEVIRSLCEEALRRSNGVRNGAARMLRISRDSLYRYMKRFGLEREDES
ncbi:MAG: PAS domain S-box protein [Desulfomonile tiedjei]|nr:PAS domain S-box protein [Desulfomonile tiedjei]